MRGFTLIELLIVVAIIGILAAIAIPNFLDAQTRAKIARVQGDMSAVEKALESYYVDQDAYPPGPIAFAPPYPEVRTYLLSTPVSYISSIPFDIFNQSPEADPPGGPFGITGGYLGYVHQPELIEMGMLHELWVLLSYGPNGVLDRDEPPLYYDSTNGTVSDGNIFKVGNRP